MHTLKNAFLVSTALVSSIGIHAAPAKAQIVETDLQTLEACSTLTIPEPVDLLNPTDPKLTRCLPGLDSVFSRSHSLSENIQRGVGKLDIGNQGSNSLDSLTYSVARTEIEVRGTVRAKQITTIKVPVFATKSYTVNVPWVHVEMKRHCTSKPWGGAWCVNEPVKVNGVQAEVKTEKVQVGTREDKETLYSATCSYVYTLNTTSGRSDGGLNCGQGRVGVLLNFGAIASVMQGEVPSLSELINTFDPKVPAIKDISEDTYESTVSSIREQNSDARIYFSHQPFVETASVENLGAEAILSVVTAGAATPLVMQQLEDALRGEFTTFTSWAVQNGVEMSFEQFNNLVSGQPVDLSGLHVGIKLLNIPVNQRKCILSRCTPALPKPRLGFAILVQGTK